LATTNELRFAVATVNGTWCGNRSCGRQRGCLGVYSVIEATPTPLVKVTEERPVEQLPFAG